MSEEQLFVARMRHLTMEEQQFKVRKAQAEAEYAELELALLKKAGTAIKSDPTLLS